MPLSAMLRSGLIQAKLTINSPNDEYEQEADQVAGQVMQMSESKVQLQTEPEEEEGEETLQTKALAEQIKPLVQMQVEPEEAEEDETTAQTKRAGGKSSQMRPGLVARIHSLKGGGQPLPKLARNFFEPRFGYDFGQVRIHTDAQAATTARAMSARAFTTGRDVVFGSGEYSPGTEDGKRLLAHELTHVMQQGIGNLQTFGEGLSALNSTSTDSPRPVQVGRTGFQVQRQVVVHPASSTVSRIDTSRTSAQIGVQAGGGIAYGLTHHNIPPTIVTPDTAPRRRGGSWHVAVWRADAFPRVDNTIYIASNLEANSCPFRRPLDHEAGHVLDAYAIMVRHRGLLVSDLEQLPGPSNPIVAPNVPHARLARQQIRDRLAIIDRCVRNQACYDMYRAAFERDVEEYPSVFAGCPPPHPPVPRVPPRNLVNVLCQTPPAGCPRPIVTFP